MLGARRLYCLYQRPQNVLYISDDICARVDVGEQTWCYFKMQWHSLGQHKVLLFKSLQNLLYLSFGTLASSAAAPPLHFFTLCTGKDKRKRSGVFAADPGSVTTVEENLEHFKHAQGSSSRDVVSQGTFCQCSEREQRKRESKNKQSEVIFRARKWLAKYDGQLFI